MKNLDPDAKITFHLGWEEGKGGSSSFDEYPAIVRLTALLRPFMNTDSPIELHAVWNAITADETLVSAETREVMTQNFTRVESDIGGIALVLNQRQLKASDVYFAYAEGMFFNEDPQAKKLLEGLSWGPGAQMVQFLFHSVCQNFCKLVFEMRKVIMEVERNTPALALPARDPQCIYCLGREGDFDEEHVVPEAFGVDDLILTDGACSNCKLSDLDQYLAEFEPLAVLRVQNVPLTKKGKFPRAETRDFTMEKVKPRLIRLVNKSGKDALTKEKLSDGTTKLTLHTATRKPVDILRLARAIFKIALGVVAVDSGVAYACEPRFDAARAFIKGTGVMPNHFLMPRNAQMDGEIVLQWHRDVPTVVVVSFWGVSFVVNLETLPLDIPPEVPADSYYAFWLGETTKNGVVKPCVGECSHREEEQDHTPIPG